MKKIPNFKNEEEMAGFWDTHDSTEYESEIIKTPGKKPKRVLSMRLDEDTIKQIETIAEKKGIWATTLARMWILEKLHNNAS